MIHLTLTGYDAGRPLCPVNKVEAKELGERFFHAMYFNFDAPYAADLCPECKAEYDAAMQEDDDE
jgi:hypothetical protein